MLRLVVASPSTCAPIATEINHTYPVFNITNQDIPMETRQTIDSVYRFSFRVTKGVRLERFIIRVGYQVVIEFDAHELKACHSDAPWNDTITQIDLWQTTIGDSPVAPHRPPFFAPFLSDTLSNENKVKGNALSKYFDGIWCMNPHHRIVLSCSFSSPPGDDACLIVGGCIADQSYRERMMQDPIDHRIYQRHFGTVATGSDNALLRICPKRYVEEIWVHWPAKDVFCSANRGISTIKLFSNSCDITCHGPRGFIVADDETVAVRLGIDCSRIDYLSITIQRSPFFHGTTHRNRVVGQVARKICILRRWVAAVSKDSRGSCPRLLPPHVEKLIFHFLFHDQFPAFPEKLPITIVSRGIFATGNRQEYGIVTGQIDAVERELQARQP